MTAPIAWASSATSLIWLALLHSLWLGTALAALASSFARPARARLVPLALAAIPLGSLLLAFIHMQMLSHPELPTSTLDLASIAPIRPSPASPQPTLAADSPAARPQPDARRLASLLDAARPYTLAAWSIGTLSHLGMIALGLVGSLRLARSGEPAPEPLADRARRLARPLRLAPSPEVRLRDDLAQPCLAGLRRPRILLPRRWTESAPPETLDAVLAHELAHASRRDPLAALWQRAVAALFSFHPAVRRLERLARHDREILADALAARLTGNPLALAEAIESVARHTRTSATVPPMFPWPRPLIPGAADPPLRERIQEILGMTPQPRPRLARIRTLILLALATPTAVLASAAGLPSQAPTPRPAKRVPPDPPMIAMQGIRIETDVDTLNLVTTAGRTNVKLDDGKFAVIVAPIDLRRPIEIAPGQAATLRAFSKTLIDGKPESWGFADEQPIILIDARGEAIAPPPGRKPIAPPYAFVLEMQALDRGKPRMPPNPAEQLRLTVPEGTTVIIRKDHPDHPNRKHFYLFTPRHILTELEEGALMKRLPAPK